MYLFLGSFTGLDAGVQVTSNEVEILNASLAGDTISINSGTLYVNGVAKGTSAVVFTGDKIRVVLVSPSAGHNRVEYITQGSTRIGYMVVSSKPEVKIEYDPANDTLFAYETNKVWTPGATRTLIKTDLSGNTQDTLDLNSAPQQSNLYQILLACDYNRDQVLVIDTSLMVVSAILSDGAGPTEAVTSYDSVYKQRQFTFVAYHKTGIIAVYDDEFTLKSTVASIGAAYLALNGNTLIVGHKNSPIVKTYTINANGTLTASTVYTMDASVTALFVSDSTIYVCAGNRVTLLDKTLVATLTSPVRDYSVTAGKAYFTFGHSNSVVELDLSTKALRTGNALNAVFLNNILARPDGTLWVYDVDGGAYYTGTLDTLTATNSHLSPFGVILTDSIYLLDLYPTLPTKSAIKRLEYTIDRTQFVDIEDHTAGDDLQTGDIIVTTNLPVNITLVSSLESTVASVDLEPVSNVFQIASTGVISTLSPTSYETPDPTVIGFIIGDTYVESQISIDNADIIPDNFYFEPKYGQPLSEYVFSSDLEITGIDETITLTSDATIFVNGILEAQPVTVAEGDMIRLRVLTSDVPDFITTAIVNINNRFYTPFSVSTLSQTLERPMPLLNIDHTYDNSLNKRVQSPTVTLGTDFEPTTVRIPSVYNAYLIVNGVDVGQSATLYPGDTVAISAVTTYNLDAPHTIPLMMPWHTEYWIAWTIGDTMPGPFDFGTLEGLDLKQYVSSNVVVPSGLSDNTLVTFRVPYGIELYVNNENLSRGPLDWRGVPLLDYIVKVRLPKKSSVQLKGYPRTDYGSTHKIPVYIGSRQGFWTLSTFDTVDTAIDYRFESEQLLPSIGVTVNGSNHLELNGEREAQVYNPYDSVLFEREAVVVKDTSVQFERQYSTTSTTSVVEYAPVFQLESNPFHTFDQNLAGVSTSSTHSVDRNTEFDILTSNNPISFERNLPFTVVTTITVADDIGFEFSSVSNAMYTSPMKLDAVSYSNSVLYATINLPESLEAFAVTSSFYTASIFSAETFPSSFWTTPLFTDLLAEVYGSWDNLTFFMPYEVVVENRLEWKPDFTHSPNTSWYEWKPAAKPDLISGIYSFDPVWNYESSNGRYSWMPNFEPSLNTNLYEAYVEAKVDSTSPIYSFEHQIEYISHNLYEVENQTARIEGHSSYEAEISPATVFSRHDPIEFDMVQFVAESRLDYAAITPSELQESDSIYERTPLPGTLHPGYFISYGEAVDNAHVWGMEDGDFYIAQVPDKGYVWIVTIECANLCNPNDCPARGYIHGG